MQELKQKIISHGRALNDQVLLVDSFLNHQVDVPLMVKIGEAFANHYAGSGVTRVMTIESSGIAPAMMTANQLGVPLVVLKKQNSAITRGDVYTTSVHSFTKQTEYRLTLSAKYVSDEDRVLVIDDFLAMGEAALGALNVISQSGAVVVGFGIVIEKSFQRGRDRLLDKGYEVYSLARVKHMTKDHIEFHE